MNIFSIAIILLPMLVTIGVISFIVFEKAIMKIFYVLFLLAQKIDDYNFKRRKKK